MQRRLAPPVRTARATVEREPPADSISLEPSTTYEVLTRRMVEDLATEVSAIRNRIDTMFWVVIVSVVTDALLRLAG